MRLQGTRGTDEAVDNNGWTTANTGWIIMSHLLTGILMYAALGWLLSLWLGRAPLLIGAGALIGMFLSLYLIHRRLEATTPGKDQAVPDRATRILRGHRRGTS
jgi:F0F1-type ATP synthase assembly protein I